MAPSGVEGTGQVEDHPDHVAEEQDFRPPAKGRWASLVRGVHDGGSIGRTRADRRARFSLAHGGRGRREARPVRPLQCWGRADGGA